MILGGKTDARYTRTHFKRELLVVLASFCVMVVVAPVCAGRGRLLAFSELLA